MYVLLLLLLVGVGAGLVAFGRYRGRSVLVALGIAWIVATLGFFAVLSLWGEALWYDALGYARRFGLFIGAQVGTAVAAALAAAIGALVLTWPLRRARADLVRWATLIAALGAAIGAESGWQTVLLFLNRVPMGVAEPIWGLDAGFYLFTLPFLDLLQGVLLWTAVVAVAAILLAVLAPRIEGRAPPAALSRRVNLDGLVHGASLALAVAIGLDLALGAFRLLYSQGGVVAGPGWTDVHLRLPGMLVLAVLIPLLIAAGFVGPVRRAAARLDPFSRDAGSAGVRATGLLWAIAGVSWLGIGVVLPWLGQRLLVEPNEITYERPYIANDIRLTRLAFGLNDVEERQYPIKQTMDRAVIDNNEELISQLRLWDWRALDDVYKQFQEIRLYYEFSDVDIDRYRLDDTYREVMVSAREVEQDNLPPVSQTFVNRRFKYTHGYGVTLAGVNEFTASGLPRLLVKDIPPVASDESLELQRPEIYYGELTKQPVVANTTEQEFDYPSGEDNVYTHYAGNGGVELDGLWRKFLFGWKFDGTAFLLSSYPRSQSRVMFHREIRDRVRRLAPFLAFDRDPYIVIANGRLYWIIDAYTHSDRFPYSTILSSAQDPTNEVAYLHGANYVRNSVKVVVDAYEGTTDFYVFDPDDPVLRAWRNALPGLFHDANEMPAALRRHVRYPEGLLLTQGLVYAEYHMTDPTVFYNQEDLWVRATEKYYDRVQPVEPYYILWELPGSKKPEFVLMLPFTPKDRQVLVGWIAGLSDGADYGRFLAYQFPKEKRVLGPQQVETKIDQDRFLSGQLTLWDQRGSSVIRGNVLAIPLDGDLLYVEPIYLRAETAAYPELRIVVAMHDDEMGYGDTLDEALGKLFGGEKTSAPAATPAPTASYVELGRRANDAFQRYLKAQGEGRFVDAAHALEALKSILAKLTGSAFEGEQTP